MNMHAHNIVHNKTMDACSLKTNLDGSVFAPYFLTAFGSLGSTLVKFIDGNQLCCVVAYS